MNKQEYSNREIKEYLLGALPETETERFDELSFADEEFADALNFAEKDLLDAYARDELDDATLKKFNSYYLASPLRREKAQFAKAFQKFAEHSFTEPDKEVLIVADSNSKRGIGGFFSAFNIFAAGNPALRWGFAAGLILVVLTGFWIISTQREDGMRANREMPLQNQPNQPEIAGSQTEKEIAETDSKNIQPEQHPKKEQSPKPPTPLEKLPPKKELLPAKTIIAFVLAPPLRDAGQVKNISIPKRTSEMAAQLQLEFDDYPAYRVALVNQSGDKNLWVSGKVKAKSNGENKSLNIRFPANLLKSQTYSLVVSGISASGETEIIGNYPFRAVIK